MLNVEHEVEHETYKTWASTGPFSASGNEHTETYKEAVISLSVSIKVSD